MQKISIIGGTPLNGEAVVHGAKNGALPVLAATLLINGKSVIHNCPDLTDVRASLKILSSLGCKCTRDGATVTVDAKQVNCDKISEDLMREMRSSIVFLGAVAARCRSAQMSMPGGCEIGIRPIDIHLSALREMGLEITEEHGNIKCKCNKNLHGSNIYIPIPSVGATENIMIAASVAEGTTKISNAAREPEIIELAEFLNSAGADIRGAGSGDIIINGVNRLEDTEHTVIPDRILCATYMSAVAITRGSAVIKNVNREHITAITEEFLKMGCKIEYDKNELKFTAPKRLKRLKSVTTQYYPGFPTDAGPVLLASTVLSKGTSVFYETIFENRFKFSGELSRLGADIKVKGRTAVVEGVEKLSGAGVKCTDLRGGAALMTSAFAAEGETVLREIHHILRGYENPVENFSNLGANIKGI